MNELIEVFENIRNFYTANAITTTNILSVLLIVGILSMYEFTVYRYVSHGTFYNKSLNVTIAVLPFFISTIILTLQSNVVVTLGTIGALAIIRFRTAVKNPIDMIYILWSIYIGIICGCQLYAVAILTSIVVSIIILVLENVNFGKRPYVVVVHTNDNSEDKLEEVLKQNSRSYRFKSRNYTSEGMDYAIEISVKSPKTLAESLKKCDAVEKFSIIKYDVDDIV